MRVTPGLRRVCATLVMASVLIAGIPHSVPDRAYAAPALDVAIVYSTASDAWCDTYGRGYAILEKQDVLYDYLDGKGWNVAFISDADLEQIDVLRQYDVVVCMWVFGMSTTASRTLTRYVAEGGGLVVPYASSRVAPGEGGGEVADHYVKLMNSELWEWGPLSEVHQARFIDDVGAFEFSLDPAPTDPIVTGARAILAGRGLDTDDLRLRRDDDRNRGAWIEYVRLLKGNTNTVQFLGLTQTSAPTGSANYNLSGAPGAVRATYLSGRAVHFYFSPVDFVWNQDGIGVKTNSDGVRQLDIAGAYIESAIEWAAGEGGRPGVLVRDGRTNATVNVYRDGMNASVYVSNAGNVQVTGTLRFRVYAPSGALVKESVRYKIATEPGQSYRYSEQYVPGTLAAGAYRVETEYHTTYPAYERRWVESVNVVRGQGVGIPTAMDPVRTSGQVVYDPRVVRLAGADRYATALAIADAAGGYPRPGGYVVVAGGEGADALLASSLCGAYDAPLVLTRRDALPVQTDEWLRNASRGFRHVIIVGGTGVVSEAVEERLRTMFGSDGVTRYSGADRYETSAAVIRAVAGRLGDSYDGGLVVANGYALVDAAAGSAVAAGRRWPIAYVERESVPATITAAIAEAGGPAGAPAWIAGGTGVVSADVERDLAATGRTVERAAGADRYDTAVALAQLAAGDGASWSRMGMASGVSIADALCLGSYLSQADGVMLLTNGAVLGPSTESLIKSKGAAIGTVVVGGGSGVVRHEVSARVTQLLP